MTHSDDQPERVLCAASSQSVLDRWRKPAHRVSSEWKSTRERKRSGKQMDTYRIAMFFCLTCCPALHCSARTNGRTSHLRRERNGREFSVAHRTSLLHICNIVKRKSWKCTGVKSGGFCHWCMWHMRDLKQIWVLLLASVDCASSRKHANRPILLDSHCKILGPQGPGRANNLFTCNDAVVAVDVATVRQLELLAIARLSEAKVAMHPVSHISPTRCLLSSHISRTNSTKTRRCERILRNWKQIQVYIWSVSSGFNAMQALVSISPPPPSHQPSKNQSQTPTPPQPTENTTHTEHAHPPPSPPRYCLTLLMARGSVHLAFVAKSPVLSFFCLASRYISRSRSRI